MRPIRLISLFMMLLMLALALVACRSQKNDVSSGVSTTETVTEAPAPNDTGEPTEAPTKEPTEAPTAEPATEPSPCRIVLSDFSECAELIAAIAPGEGENELCYSLRSNGGSYDGGPVSFSVSEGKLWIWDPYKYHGEQSFQSLFVYDLETGEGERVRANEYNEMERNYGLTVIGSKIIRHNSVFDIESGEVLPIGGDIEYFGQCFEDGDGIFGFIRQDASASLIRLGEEGWTVYGTIAEIEPSDDGWELWTVLESGVSFCVPKNAGFAGRDAEGSFYFVFDYLTFPELVEVEGEAEDMLFIKINSAGELEKAVSPNVDHESWGDGATEEFVLAGDGCFYCMYVFEDRTEFYKITL